MTEVVLKHDRAGMGRGFGFVTYKNEDTVERILSMSHEINGKVVSAFTISTTLFVSFFLFFFCLFVFFNNSFFFFSK